MCMRMTSNHSGVRFVVSLLAATVSAVGATECKVNPEAGAAALEIRAESTSGAKVLEAIKPSPSLKISRLDTIVRADGAWLQVQHGAVKGWVKAERLICRMPPEQAREAVAPVAMKVLTALKDRDMASLAAAVHPVLGVRFAPYAFLNQRANVRFDANAIREALNDKRIRLWGTHDGSGDPIRLSFADYYKRYVYDRDFRQAKLSYNSGPAIRGNTHDNSHELFPNAIVVDALQPGVSPEREGGDYRILRLVFEQHQGRWYLTYIAHDQWTV